MSGAVNRLGERLIEIARTNNIETVRAIVSENAANIQLFINATDSVRTQLPISPSHLEISLLLTSIISGRFWVKDAVMDQRTQLIFFGQELFFQRVVL